MLKFRKYVAIAAVGVVTLASTPAFATEFGMVDMQELSKKSTALESKGVLKPIIPRFRHRSKIGWCHSHGV